MFSGGAMGTEIKQVLLDMGRQCMPGEEDNFVVYITRNEVEESMKMPKNILWRKVWSV